MKIVSPDILHKTDAGGVLVGRRRPRPRCAAAFDEIVANARAYDAGRGIDGVQVQQMARPAGRRSSSARSPTRPSARSSPSASAGCWWRSSRTSPSGWPRSRRRGCAVDARRHQRGRDPARACAAAEPVDREALAEHDPARSPQLVADFPRDRRGGPQPGLRRRRRRDGRRHPRSCSPTGSPRERRALHARRRSSTSMRRLMQAALGRGDRRLQRAGQDRQLGHAQPHRRRLPGRDLPGEPQGRRDPGPQGVQERSRTSRATWTWRSSPIPAKFVPARPGGGRRARASPTRC